MIILYDGVEITKKHTCFAHLIGVFILLILILLVTICIIMANQTVVLGVT